MTTLNTGAGASSRRIPTLTTLLGAAVAVAVLLLAAVWPAGEGPSVLSSASADTHRAPVAATPATTDPHDSSLPDAASVFAREPASPEEMAPTY